MRPFPCRKKSFIALFLLLAFSLVTCGVKEEIDWPSRLEKLLGAKPITYAPCVTDKSETTVLAAFHDHGILTFAVITDSVVYKKLSTGFGTDSVLWGMDLYQKGVDKFIVSEAEDEIREHPLALGPDAYIFFRVGREFSDDFSDWFMNLESGSISGTPVDSERDLFQKPLGRADLSNAADSEQRRQAWLMKVRRDTIIGEYTAKAEIAFLDANCLFINISGIDRGGGSWRYEYSGEVFKWHGAKWTSIERTGQLASVVDLDRDGVEDFVTIGYENFRDETRADYSILRLDGDSLAGIGFSRWSGPLLRIKTDRISARPVVTFWQEFESTPSMIDYMPGLGRSIPIKAVSYKESLFYQWSDDKRTVVNTRRELHFVDSVLSADSTKQAVDIVVHAGKISSDVVGLLQFILQTFHGKTIKEIHPEIRQLTVPRLSADVADTVRVSTVQFGKISKGQNDWLILEFTLGLTGGETRVTIEFYFEEQGGVFKWIPPMG